MASSYGWDENIEREKCEQKQLDEFNKRRKHEKFEQYLSMLSGLCRNCWGKSPDAGRKYLPEINSSNLGADLMTANQKSE